MYQERCYTQPSCTLTVWWKESLLSDWVDRKTVKEIQFCLRLGDQIVEGNREQLQDVLASVELYVQRFLTKDRTLPSIHRVLGMQLSTLELVDISNALEAFSTEMDLLPAEPQETLTWGFAFTRSVAVGIFSVIVGAFVGMGLASRHSSNAPQVVSAPNTTLPTEVFTAPPPAAPPPPKAVLPPAPKALPPVRVYPRPATPPPSVLPSVVAKSATHPTLPASDLPLDFIPEEKEQDIGVGSPPPPGLLIAPTPENNAPLGALSRANESAKTQPPATGSAILQQVELSSSPELTQSLVEYVQALPLPITSPGGSLTLDVSVEQGAITTLQVEGTTAENQAALTQLETSVKSWTPPPAQSGRVRIQVSVP